MIPETTTAPVQSSVQPPRNSFHAWAVVAMLFPVALLNYLDRMMVATMRASIRADIPTIANDADTSSWRNAFWWFGAAGVCYAIFLLMALRESETKIVGRGVLTAPPHVGGTAVGAVGTPRPTIAETLKSFLGTGAFLIMVVYFTLPALGGWAIKNWLPTFLGHEFNLKQGRAGMLATGCVTIASFAGALLGGTLADRAMRSMPRGRIYVSALGVGLCVPALFGLGHLSSMSMAIGCMIMFGFGFGF